MVPCFTRTNTQWSLWDHLSFRFAVKSLEGHLARSLSPEIRVVSPEIFSQVVRNAESCGSNNTLASLLHIYRPFFVSSKTNKRDILLIYRACFVVHQGLKRERYYTWAYIACFVLSLLKERGILHIYSACFVSWWFKNEIYYPHFLLKKTTDLNFVSLCTSSDKIRAALWAT